MFVSFNNYTSNKFGQLSDYMRKLYKTKSEYQKSYFTQYNFTQWLESIRGLTLTESQLRSVVNSYVTFAELQPSDVPYLLTYLSRNYSISVPVEYGMSTARFWAARIK